ncbi:MAG: hypothetical protein WC838_00420 [Candidatus Margulisiibacteriota bacterium]|jgi:hypothetical protein
MRKRGLLQFKVLSGLFLMLISQLGWIAPLIILPLGRSSLESKGLILAFWLVFGNVTFNLGAFLVGAELIKKLRRQRFNLHFVWGQMLFLYKIVHKWLTKKYYIFAYDREQHENSKRKRKKPK